MDEPQRHRGEDELGSPAATGPHAWFAAPAGTAVVLSQLAARARLAAPEGFADWCATLADWQRQGWWIALALHYPLGHGLEPACGPVGAGAQPAGGESAAPPSASPRRDAGGDAIPGAGRSAFASAAAQAPREDRVLARAWAFRRHEKLDAAAAAQRLALAAATPAGVIAPRATVEQEAFAAAVAAIHAGIGRGDYYQVNYCFELDFRWFGPPFSLFARLLQRQPSDYAAFLCDDDEVVTSLSPELFLERHGARLVTRPMKGTAVRDDDPAQDRRAAEGLAASVKDRAENVMIVDLLRNDLGRLARPGSVVVERLCEIEAYPTVWQMTSTIAAELADGGADRGIAALLAALFPCGSVTGAPKIAAMRAIAALETTPRHLYTGAVGWLAPDGDLRLNVAIRTPELGPGHRGRMGIGAGITIDSEPAAEYAECLAKAKFLIAADPGLALFETMRAERGGAVAARVGVRRLTAHLDRLAASAHAFGFPFDVATTRAAVDRALAAARGEGPWRLRLVLDRRGAMTTTLAPLDSLPPHPTVRIATAALAADDPLRAHKTTARALYDRALTALAALARGRQEGVAPAVGPEVAGVAFDALFFNTRGELVEGARSNVFLRRGDRLYTPPLASGCLPGVLRAELIAAGRATERVLGRADLAVAEEVLLGNALRGLLAVAIDPRPLLVEP